MLFTTLFLLPLTTLLSLAEAVEVVTQVVEAVQVDTARPIHSQSEQVLRLQSEQAVQVAQAQLALTA
jgi:hypothetical protein